jgi:hypothetical protein
MNKSLILYSVNNQKYLKEAVISAESAKQHMPDVDLGLLTYSQHSDPIFDFHVRDTIHSTRNWFFDQVYLVSLNLPKLYSSGYTKIIWMDSDTYFCEPVYELFDMLDFYDFMGIHAPARQVANIVQDIPSSFPEINIGMIPMRNGQYIQSLFYDMVEWYRLHIDLYKKNDQGVLRDVLWHYALRQSGPRLYILPPEYNCRFNYSCFVAGRVKILHGRHSRVSLADVAVEINSGREQHLFEMRAWNNGNFK